VAYDSILAERRKAIHERAAAGIETIFAAQIEDHLDELANHYLHAGNTAKAVEFLERAANRAFTRSAHAEAERLLVQAIALIESLPDTPERLPREIGLRVRYGMVFVAIHGFAKGELDEQLERTRELMSRAGESPEILMLMAGIWSVESSRGQFKSAWETARRMLAIAEGTGSEMAIGSAQHMMGATAMWRGNFATARDHFERATEIFERDLDRYLPTTNVPVIMSRGHFAWALWSLGYPDQALRRTRESLNMARKLNRPYSMAFALQFAIAVEDLCGDHAQMRAQSEALIELSEQHGYPHWLASGKMSLGAIIVGEEDFDRGLAMMREGMAGTREFGTLPVYRYGLIIMAYAFLRAGKIDEGLRALDEASEGIELEDRFNEAEIWRVRGEFMMARRNERAAAECFHRAIDIARTQQAKSRELRAAFSLARLLASQDNAAGAIEVLAPVYGWFSEGFDTADLTMSRALLDGLKQRIAKDSPHG